MKRMIACITLSAMALATHAHQMTDRECLRAAADLYLDAIDKANGVTFEAQMTEAKDGIAECHKSPKCLYKDEQDDTRVYDFLTELYRGTFDGMTPKQIADGYFAQCVAAIPATK